MLKIVDFSKIYPGNKVGAKNISLQVDDGDIFAFIGHNGAGKTTTIKCIVGISELTSGDILLDEVSIKTNPIDFKSKIAYVPDNPDIYNSLTGKQFINLIASIYRVKTEQYLSIMEKLSKELELSDALDNPIGTYSHGMKQKLVIISALIHSPKLLVLDEPFVGLDPKASFNLKNIMQEFCKNGGTIFFSTHVLEVAEKLCNKVAIIKNGEIIRQGTMSEVKKNLSLEEVFLESEND